MDQSNSANNGPATSAGLGAAGAASEGVGLTLGTGSIDDLIYRFSRILADKIYGEPGCQQIVIARQTAEVSCKGTDAAAIAAKTGPLCMSLVRAKSPDASKYCNSCYLGNADQTIVVKFTATCLNNVVSKAINSVVSDLDAFADAGNQQYIDAKNKLVQTDLASNITQYLLVNQNITVNDGNQVISGTSQTAIMDIVYRAVIESDVIGLLADMKDALTYCRRANGEVYLCKKEPEVPKLPNAGDVVKSTDGAIVAHVDITDDSPAPETNERDTSDEASVNFYIILAVIVAVILAIVGWRVWVKTHTPRVTSRD